MSQRIELIVFDMDDTLFEELSYVRSGFRAVANRVSADAKASADEIHEFLLRDFEQNGRGNNFNNVASHFLTTADDASGTTTPSVRELVRVYREHDPEINLTPGVEPFLSSLRQTYRISLLTDGWEEVQRRKVNALRLNEMFDHVIYSQSAGLDFAKPHPRFFQETLDHFDVAPEHTLMVGDDEKKDIAGSRAMNIHAFQVRHVLSSDERAKLLEHLASLSV